MILSEDMTIQDNKNIKAETYDFFISFKAVIINSNWEWLDLEAALILAADNGKFSHIPDFIIKMNAEFWRYISVYAYAGHTKCFHTNMSSWKECKLTNKQELLDIINIILKNYEPKL